MPSDRDESSYLKQACCNGIFSVPFTAYVTILQPERYFIPDKMFFAKRSPHFVFPFCCRYKESQLKDGLCMKITKICIEVTELRHLRNL